MAQRKRTWASWRDLDGSTHITRALPWNRDLYVGALLSGAYCLVGGSKLTAADNVWCLLHSPYISRRGLSSPRAHASTGTLEAWYIVLVQEGPQGLGRELISAEG